MKYIIWLLAIASICCISLGYILNNTYSQKLIGTGVVILFVIVFPLFSYYRWKDKNLKDYMLNSENIEKMRQSQRLKK